MKHLLYIVLPLALLLQNCERPDVCLKGTGETNEYTVKLGDTLQIQSCSQNAQVYIWKIDGREVNTFLDPPMPFYEHYAPDGGEACSPYVHLIFHDTGRYRLNLEIARLKNGTCESESAELGRSDATKAYIRVRP